MFAAAMTSSSVPETPGPMTSVTRWSAEPSCTTEPLRPRTPIENRRASRKTIVECPSEKKKPTLRGRCPWAMSLRVVLSIALMWSASKACRSPSA